MAPGQNGKSVRSGVVTSMMTIAKMATCHFRHDNRSESDDHDDEDHCTHLPHDAGRRRTRSERNRQAVWRNRGEGQLRCTRGERCCQGRQALVGMGGALRPP